MSHGETIASHGPFKLPKPSHVHNGIPQTIHAAKESSIWEVYINEAVVVDNELVKDWTSSLNFLLVFAAIFSSVLSAFIIESKRMLEQDPTDVVVDALIFLINNTTNATHTPYSRPVFSPEPYALSVNCLLFSSLSASIVAALASVVALQWVADYDAAVSRSGSSPEDRVKRRQFRYGGMEQWKMREIIAFLPILLYWSLVLFFAGIAQWMWNLHKTVGGVILGGMLLGAAFYIATTLLAVVFPSSPYRAPLVHLIYRIFHLISCAIQKPYRRGNEEDPEDGTPSQKLSFSELVVEKITPVKNFLVNIPSRFQKSKVQERDQAWVGDKTKSLINDSLSWLAQNISISPDSRHRLLLLVDEASKLDKEQQASKRFKDIPWNQIFRLLGAEYGRYAASRELTEEDEKDLEILLRCLRNPRMGRIIAPNNPEEYKDSTSTSSVAEQPREEGPNPLYLLRNIHLNEKDMSIKDQVKLRVGFLNQAHWLPRLSRDAGSYQRRLTLDNACDDLISLLSGDANLRPHDPQERVDTLVCLTHLRRPPLSDLELAVGSGGHLHISRPSRLIYRLCCVNWITAQVNHPHIHRILQTLASAQRSNPNLRLSWNFTATDKEVDAALALVNPRDKQALETAIKSEREKLYLVETLGAFDELVTRNCSEAQHEAMVELVCYDLRKSRSHLYSDYFTDRRKRSLRSLQDPSLRLVGFIAAGMYEDMESCPTDITIPRCLRQLLGKSLLEEPTLDKSPTIHKLRVRFWQQLNDATTRHIMEKALANLETLKRLQIEFTQPSLGIDDGGDFFLQVMHTPLSMDRFRLHTRYGRVPALLAHDGLQSFELEFYEEGRSPKPECINHLLQLCANVKQSPERLTHLLIQLTKVYLEAMSEWPEPRLALEIQDLMDVASKYCIQSDTRPSIAKSHELAQLLTNSRDAVATMWEKLLAHPDSKLMARLGGKDNFSARCTRAIRDLTAPKLTTFGIRANYSIICAQPVLASDAGVGWLGMHIE